MKKYGAILIDPPWAFRTYSKQHMTPHRCAEDHYPVLDARSIAQFDILPAKDCALFMWVVDSHLDQALTLMNAWGFAFKTIAFVWVKTTKDGTRPRIGMGYWTRKSAEICLLATRGKPRRRSKAVRQVILESRREHSRKPDIYDRIEALVEGPYCEVFARQRWPGWDAIGDEVEKFNAFNKSPSHAVCP